jgi:hypothetical protein
MQNESENTEKMRTNLLCVTQENGTELRRKQKIESTRTQKNQLQFITMFSQLEYIGFYSQFYCLRTSAWVLVSKVSASLLSDPL